MQSRDSGKERLHCAEECQFWCDDVGRNCGRVVCYATAEEQCRAEETTREDEFASKLTFKCKAAILLGSFTAMNPWWCNLNEKGASSTSFPPILSTAPPTTLKSIVSLMTQSPIFNSSCRVLADVLHSLVHQSVNHPPPPLAVCDGNLRFSRS